MPRQGIGCIGQAILYGCLGIAFVATLAFLLEKLSPETGTLLWEGLGQQFGDLIQKIKEAVS